MQKYRVLIGKFLSNSIKNFVRNKTNGQVVAGPFVGLKYINRSVCSAYGPKLLGIYERELHPIIEEIIRANFEVIIDIGAAEGFYAVGLARSKENLKKIYAFEMEEQGRTALAEMASLNDVIQRVTVLGKCEVSDLQAILLPNRKTLVVCDIEGYEVELLNPDLIPELAHTHILVELHETAYHGVEELLTG